MFQQKDEDLYIIQMRSHAIKGEGVLFVNEMLDYIKKEGFQQVIFLTGFDASMKNDQDISM